MADTMTRCPDLDQAIESLRFAAKQLRGLEERLRTIDTVKHYKQLGRLEFERDDMRDRFKVKASTLCIHWRTLLLFVEETERLRVKYGRRPTVKMLENAIEAAQAFAERAALETDASLVLLKFKNQAAHDGVADAAAGRAYMEASRP